MSPTALSFVILTSILSGTLVYILVGPNYNFAMAQPFNSTFFSSNNTIVLAQPLNTTLDTSSGRMVIIPDVTVIGPGGVNDPDPTPYKCEKKVGEIPTCRSDKGDVADGIALALDQEKVCKGGLTITKDEASCEWKQ